MWGISASTGTGSRQSLAGTGDSRYTLGVVLLICLLWPEICNEGDADDGGILMGRTATPPKQAHLPADTVLQLYCNCTIHCLAAVVKNSMQIENRSGKGGWSLIH
jgi:hypothetical protein